jgi:hypothetical protein
MNSLFAQLTLADIDQDVARNIASLREPRNPFDDLTPDPAGWLLAEKLEADVSPPPWQSATPVIDRPFENADWFNAIFWPFENWQRSRFSDGSFGVWYGSESVETTVFESAWHWYRGLLSDAGFEALAQHSPVISERKVWSVACRAALLDFRNSARSHPGLLQPSDHSFCQSVGARIHREGHPGLLTPSVRRPAGENFVIFNPRVLSNPRENCLLSYRLEGEEIAVEREPGVTWFRIAMPRRGGSETDPPRFSGRL